MTRKTFEHLLLKQHPTRMGAMVLARTPQGLYGVWFVGQKHFPTALGGTEAPNDALLCEAAAQIDTYLAGTRRAFDLPLDLTRGTAFQRAVWQALQSIACGQTLSYGALAVQLGQPQAVRAVAAAVGRNPLSLVVPCHRVLGVDGSLTGYAGGLERKRALLQLEQHHD
ncbi:methylated-DNA--[protein]-cysteine S-methyltransferase [Curvibacter sp. APW13]|uniref:methylated-DNA--[protein]-cysteine S-methyltransferase n=1 Tax=Curvibacter sp. APW13 TaxID=3077236 RepID=UPI0028DE737F|nr:methylated-DNA--[protein]-cysteine S-methyltransferase [Curvibacter sp. APW13]MDT8990962.1 methylated-DNA--[protein]-cysteine S-methyltransferase [Curvibacter sp. APW13]